MAETKRSGAGRNDASDSNKGGNSRNRGASPSSRNKNASKRVYASNARDARNTNRNNASANNGAKNAKAAGGSAKKASGSENKATAGRNQGTGTIKRSPGSQTTSGKQGTGRTGNNVRKQNPPKNQGTGRKQAAAGSAAANNSRNTARNTGSRNGSKAGKYEEYLKMTPDKDNSLRDEIGLVAAALICVLMILSYLNLCGTFGNMVNKVVFGLFGGFGYVFPIVLFTVILFAISNKRNVSIVAKTIYCFLIMIDISAIVQLLGGELLGSGFDKTLKFTEYFTNSQLGFDGPDKTYGGFLGGGVCKILCPILGKIGTGCVLFAGLIILLALILGKAILTAITRRSMEGISNIRQRRRERREEETREYEEMLRRDEYAGSYDDEDEPGYDEEGYDGSGYDEDDPDAADDEDQQDFEFPEHLMTSGRIAERKTEYSDAERRRYLSRLRKEARKKQKESGDSFLSRLLNKYKSGNGHIEDTPEYKEFKEKYGVSDYEMSELIAGALQKTSRNMDAEGNYSEADLSAEDYSEEDFSEEPYDTTASGNANAEEEKDIVQKELDRKFGETPKIQVINLRERTQPAGGNTRHYFIDADPDSDDLLSTAELNEDLRKQVEHFFDDDQPASPENVDGLKKEGSYKNEKSSGNEGGFGNGESSANEGGGRNGENSGNEGGRNNEESLKNTISEKNGDIAENSLNSMNGGNAKSGDISEHGPVQKKISGENADPAGDRKNERDREVSGATGFNTPEQIKAVMEAAEEKKKNPPYEFPPYDLLKKNDRSKNIDHGELDEMVGKLQTTLESFGVKVRVGDATCGPTVTRYEIYPEQGVKVKNITALTDDIKLALAVPDIRIEAPIPGKAAVGIEVPNKSRTPVSLRELIDSDEFRNVKSKLAFAVGKDIGGKIICADIAAMPHALVAGSTGSGKSVCINSMILSILYKAKPSEVRLILIDPKRVELVGYNGIPHLLVPVVTDVKKAAGALNWAVAEMDDRYKRFEEVGVNNIETYNRLMEERYYDEGGTEEECPDRLPQILIIIDEFCDLMMTGNPKEVEATVGRLTQLARACGIHLVIATQRPAVNVITGTIKANIPSRISFSLTSVVDSRTILDQAGAEKLLGKGDMLFSPQGYPQPVRLQGAYVSDKEIADVVKYIKERCKENMYSDDISRKIEQNAAGDNKGQAAGNDSNVKSGEADDYRDELFEEAGRLIIENKKASIGSIQRKYRLGFNRAARIMDQLAEEGVVGPDEGTKPRQILMTIEQFEALIAGCNGDGGSTDDMDGNGTVTEE